ncbi:GNAT family N-acetyltransferase [Methylobacterium sp. WSM2598]|uniref:GNAT family N-acetyltransferase n=1 Tax=Methylobacterium sp. WSM2598 TaxID=398261 RepID=UPI000361D873|nr:GNAT family N-acetyltransferase [Methylobacterium sp. WSM2598]
MNAPFSPRGASASLAPEIVPAASLDPAAWDALVARAAAPSPDYGRRMIAAHLAHGLAPPDLACVVVRDGPALLALLPIRPARPMLRRSAAPFTAPLITATAPLVAEGPAFAPALAALVAGLARVSDSWRWPLLPAGTPAGAGLLAAMAEAGWGVETVSRFARPVLDRFPDHAACLAAAPSRNRVKDLRRRRRRLDALGAVRVETVGPAGDLGAACAAFLALERAGWKGRVGTALASRPATAALAADLFGAGEGPVTARADLLRLDGVPIAASVALTCRRTVFLLKTAYDERYAAFAPGALLEAEIVRALHEGSEADRLDSATQDSRVLADLYPGRSEIVGFAASAPGGPPVAALAAALRRSGAWRARAAALRAWLRRAAARG